MYTLTILVKRFSQGVIYTIHLSKSREKKTCKDQSSPVISTKFIFVNEFHLLITSSDINKI